MTKRIIVTLAAIGVLLGGGAAAAHASTSHTLYRGSAPISTLYRG